MSMTLNLVEILLNTGRQLFLMGRYTEALVPLTKLAAFRKLPRPAVEELNALQAEIHFQRKDYTAARRHFTAAIAARPLKADYHYLMAVAIEEDDAAQRERAEAYYARAIELDPTQPAYWVDFGSYLFSVGKAKEGLRAVRKAYSLAPGDAEIVGEVAEVLRRENYQDEATAKLRAALFHNHGTAAFRQLWQRHQFALIRAEQQKPRATVGRGGGPVILPFPHTEPQGKYLEFGKKTIRIDQAEPTAEPKNKRPTPTNRPPRKG